MNTTLNFGRLIALMRLDFVTKNKSYIYGALGFLAVYCLFNFFGAVDGDPRDTEFHANFFPVFLIGFGLILSSFAFQEMNAPLERQTYLTLPASNLEKMTSKWILTFILFPIVFTLAYWILSIFVDRIIEFFFLMEIPRFRPTGEETIFFIKIYMAIQGLYVIGSVIFNKYALVKTGIGLFVMTILSILVMVLCVRIIFMDHFDPWSMNVNKEIRVSREVQPSFVRFIEGPFQSLGLYLFWIGLPILSWIVAFFKLKEKEV